jgi:hypothetical protein
LESASAADAPNTAQTRPMVSDGRNFMEVPRVPRRPEQSWRHRPIEE